MTTLGPPLTVAGDITSQEDIIVHGTVKGTIIMEQGALVIAPQGKAEAAVKARSLRCRARSGGTWPPPGSSN